MRYLKVSKIVLAIIGSGTTIGGILYSVKQSFEKGQPERSSPKHDSSNPDESGDSGRKKSDDTVDLESLVINFVWKEYKKEKTFIRRWLTWKIFYTFDVNWEYTYFVHTTLTDELGEEKLLDVITSNLEQAKKCTEIELFRSEYDNKTDKEQTYTLETSRDTINTTSINVQNPYTLGLKANLKINLKDIVKIGGAYNYLQLSPNEKLVKSHSWKLNTSVAVPQMHKAIVRMSVIEEKSTVSFKFKTKVHINTDSGMPVTARRKWDGKKVFTYWVENLRFVTQLNKDIKYETVVAVRGGQKYRETVLIFESTGVFENAGFNKQSVDVKYEKLTREKLQ